MQTKKQRERLVELITEAKSQAFCDICDGRNNCDNCENERIVDHLIGNGVYVPLANLGDIVYVFRWRRKKTNCKNGYWDTICTKKRSIEIAKQRDELYISTKILRKNDINFIGESIFLSKAEAEQALAEREYKDNAKKL